MTQLMKEGSRVCISPDENEPRITYGTTIDIPRNGVVAVELDKIYWDDDDDDGIREIPIELVKIVHKKKG